MPADQKHFFCRNSSGHPDRRPFYFFTDEYEVKEETVIADCPLCGRGVEPVSHCYANLSKMWDKATGPKTEEGKKRSRLNAYLHGGRSKLFINLAPANQKYSECASCEHLAECITEYQYCPVMLQPMIQIMQAYEEGRHADLKQFAGLIQGKTFQTLQQMFSRVLDDGLVVKGKLGGYKVAHPLLKLIPKYLEAMGVTADQQTMTPKSKGEDDALQGQIAEGEGAEAKKLLSDIKDEILSSVKKLDTSGAEEKRSQDPVVKKLRAANDE